MTGRGGSRWTEEQLERGADAAEDAAFGEWEDIARAVLDAVFPPETVDEGLVGRVEGAIRLAERTRGQGSTHREAAEAVVRAVFPVGEPDYERLEASIRKLCEGWVLDPEPFVEAAVAAVRAAGEGSPDG